MTRRYSTRKPNEIMQRIIKCLREHEGLEVWYSKLKRLVRNPEYLGPMLSDSSFREALRKLREVDIIVVEKPSPSKKKKLLIYLAHGTMKESSVPDSYLSDFGSRFADTGEHVSRKRHRDTERREKITQSLLFRANSGAVYSRRVTNSEIGPGQVVSFRDKKGYWYYHEYVDAQLTSEQMKELIPVSSEFDTIDGISIVDLVCQRDAGSGGVFGDMKVSAEEVEGVAKQLVNKGYLREMSRDEISEAIERTGKPARYEQLKNERRYEVANDVLEKYIFDLTDLLGFIKRRTWASRLTGHEETKVNNFWYKYYYGHEALDNLRTYARTDEKRRLASGRDGVTKIPTPFGINLEYRPRNKKDYEKEIREWDNYIRKKIVTLKCKKEYAQIRNDYPLLHEIFMKMISVSKVCF